MRYLYLISLGTLLCGGLLFAYRNNWIILRTPWGHSTVQQTHDAEKKKITISHYGRHGLVSEPHHMVWHAEHIPLNALRLTNGYLTTLYEEALLDKKIQLQHASTSTTQQELLLNFSHDLFPEAAPIYEKWMIVEGLLKTIRDELPTIKQVRLLVNHKPLVDHHLDFSKSWPVEGFLNTPAQTVAPSAVQRAQQVTIMLEPAGDAQYTGRIIDDAFERGITLQCAQELTTLLESKMLASGARMRITLSRFPGEVLEPLQNAAFANRLATNAYITISMYQFPHETKRDRAAEIAIYYFAYHPTTDFWQRQTHDLTCEPYHQAHLATSVRSNALAHTLCNSLRTAKPFAGTVNHCHGLPVKPLIGITAPALLIEIGLPHKDAWQTLVLQLAQHITHALSECL